MEPTVIQKRIHEVRGQKVMLDFDLAELYEVTTKALNQAVKRNVKRFLVDFMFGLNTSELYAMRSQNVTASLKKRNRDSMPYAFTEHGITMLASVLNSDKAIRMNIEIIRAFNALRKFAINFKTLEDKIDDLYRKVNNHDVKLDGIYDTLAVLQNEKDELKGWNDRERIGFKG